MLGNMMQEKMGERIMLGNKMGNKMEDDDAAEAIGYVTLRELLAYCREPKARAEIQEYCGLAGRRYFRAKYLLPLLESGRLRMTVPDKPRSKNQKYCSMGGQAASRRMTDEGE